MMSIGVGSGNVVIGRRVGHERHERHKGVVVVKLRELAMVLESIIAAVSQTGVWVRVHGVKGLNLDPSIWSGCSGRATGRGTTRGPRCTSKHRCVGCSGGVFGGRGRLCETQIGGQEGGGGW